MFSSLSEKKKKKKRLGVAKQAGPTD